MGATYGLRFQINFSNDLDEVIQINISQLAYKGVVQTLEADTDCLNIKSTTGDEDRLNPMCGRQAQIKVRIPIGSTVDLRSFIAQYDNAFQVNIFINGNMAAPLFQGWIVVEDNHQPLLDPPFTLTLLATDGLGTLQGQYFLDKNGNTFTGKQTIVGWVTQCLNMLPNTLNLRTYFNIYNTAMNQNSNALEQICLDAQTFQTGQQTPAGDTNPADFNTGFDDFYTVLEKIVRNFRCKLFQENGYWHLINLWDYYNQQGMTYYEYTFPTTSNGIVQYRLVGKGSVMPALQISKTLPMRLVNEDADLYLKLAKKSVELTYNYNQSLNKIVNQALDEGVAQPAQNEVIDSEIIDPSYNRGVSVPLHTFAYSAFGFKVMQAGKTATGFIDLGTATAAPAADGFIRVVDDILGNEFVRYLTVVLIPSPLCTYVQSSPILLDSGDIMQVTYSWRTRLPTSIGNARWALISVLLTGDDGSFWAMDGVGSGDLANNPTKWVSVNSKFQNSFGTMPAITTDPIPSTLLWNGAQANTVALPGVPFATAPVSGTVVILFMTADGPGTEYWFKDISVKILPYLNGAYQELQGDYNYAQSNNNILATELDTIEISDSPKRYFQGALLSSAAGDVLLTAAWFRQGVTEQFRFTQFMALILYTVYGRQAEKIEGTVRGIAYVDNGSISGTSPAGMRNVYFFIDRNDLGTSNPSTKKMMLCSFDMNYNTGQWRGVFVELNQDQNDLGLLTPDFSEFSYLYTGLNS